jgi:hypothetical protein
MPTAFSALKDLYGVLEISLMLLPLTARVVASGGALPARGTRGRAH